MNNTQFPFSSTNPTTHNGYYNPHQQDESSNSFSSGNQQGGAVIHRNRSTDLDLQQVLMNNATGPQLSMHAESFYNLDTLFNMNWYGNNNNNNDLSLLVDDQSAGNNIWNQQQQQGPQDNASSFVAQQHHQFTTTAENNNPPQLVGSTMINSEIMATSSHHGSNVQPHPCKENEIYNTYNGNAYYENKLVQYPITTGTMFSNTVNEEYPVVESSSSQPNKADSFWQWWYITFMQNQGTIYNNATMSSGMNSPATSTSNHTTPSMIFPDEVPMHHHRRTLTNQSDFTLQSFDSSSQEAGGTTIQSDAHYFLPLGHHHIQSETFQSNVTSLRTVSTHPSPVGTTEILVQSVAAASQTVHTAPTHDDEASPFLRSTGVEKWKCIFPWCTSKGYARKRELIKRHIIPQHCEIHLKYICYMHSKPIVQFTPRLDVAVSHAKNCFKKRHKEIYGTDLVLEPAFKDIPKNLFKVFEDDRLIPCVYKGCDFKTRKPKELTDHIYNANHVSKLPRKAR